MSTSSAGGAPIAAEPLSRIKSFDLNESFDLHKLYPILENLPSLKFPGHRFGIEGRKRIVLWAPGGQTRPDKPHSGKQGYRLTVKGRQWLNDRSGDRI